MELVCGLIVAERFRLIRQLGKGGMGAVWLAQHTALDVPCAIKFIHEEAAQSTDLRARFEREAKAAAQLRSPHVVQILDHGVWHDMPYIAMEYLEGEDLGQRITRVGNLAPADTYAIAAQIARALTKAHAAGLVHRDLKPPNVFLVRDDDREIAKVLDFGVAKVSEVGLDGSTKTGSILGTPYYMSPEQARGMKGLDHRADLWALAVVVYQCLTGRLPFMADAFGELLVKIIMDPLPVPSQIAAVPVGFDAWWARAVDRNPAARFQSAKELADALGLALGLSMRAADVDSLSGGLGTTGDRAAAGAPAGQGGTMLVGPTPIPQGSGVSVPVSAVSTSNAGQAIPSGMTPVGPMGIGPNGSWPGVAPTPLQQSLSVSTSPRRGGGGLVVVAVAIVGVLVVGAAGAFFFLRSNATSAASPATQAATAEPPPKAASAEPAPSTSVAPAPAAPAATATETATAEPEAPATQAAAASRARPPGVGKWPPAPAASAKAKPNCDPNFTLDASGQKHFKPECFQ